LGVRNKSLIRTSPSGFEISLTHSISQLSLASANSSIVIDFSAHRDAGSLDNA
jgi:hypothetical protein